ncbi:hypothetical protein CASFOL_023448 [Castilleja foliolosa]|uniref:Uncharacterized protein n=1 Tax=Castilleja foliolosa TaxID=1961234 RepID=A0ABD3CLR3_9LAMI
MGTKIGTLPHLRVLKLESGSFVGEVWETVEGQFGSLKYLEISDNTDLKYWRTESCAHFPCLERIFISGLTNLEAIPFDIGDTLESIEIIKCSDSAIFSANEILMEQEGLGNEGLQVKVLLFKHSPDVESLAAPNFHVKICII